MVKLKDLTPDSRNANKGTAKGQKQIIGSIQRNGFGRSGLIDKNGRIIAGNKTTEAAAEVFGIEVEPLIVEVDGTRPVYVKRVDLDLDDPDPNNPARRLAYDDNLASFFSFELDAEVVMADIEAGFDFEAMDVTLPDLGELLDKETAALLAGENPGADTEPQIDKAEELRQKWGVELGQLWALGEHRLICGDCTDAAVVARVMGGERAGLAPVDPPYNVGIEYGDNVDDSKRDEDYKAFSVAWFELCRSVSDRQIVTPGAINLLRWARWFNPKHIAPRIVNNTQVHGTVTAFWAWEPIFFFGDKFGRSRHLDLFEFASNYNTASTTFNHPCPKPLPLWEDFIAHYSEPGDIIFESFSGSGTTIIACENLSRRCRAVELDPGYVAVALQRFYDHTGIQPELIKD